MPPTRPSCGACSSGRGTRAADVGLLLIVGGFGVLSLPTVLHSVGRRLVPSEWSRLCTASIGAGALTVELGAVLYAARALPWALGIHTLPKMCERMLSHFAPGGSWAGFAAALGAAIIAALAIGGTIKSKRQQKRVWA